MTIETKIGLFVAMGVVILIGIFISDHLSVVQEQEQPKLTDPLLQKEFASEKDRDAAERLLEPSNPRESAHTDAGDALSPPDTGSPDTLTVDVRTAIAERPLEIDGRTLLTPDGSAQTTPFVEVADQGLTRNELNTLNVGLSKSDVATTPTATQPTTTLEPAGPTYHVVAKGDSLASLARQYMGKTSAWNDIYRANREKIADPDRLRVGTRLLIPNSASPAPVATTAANTQPVIKPTAATEYTVGEGETLMEVAQKTLGSASKWRQLHAANKDRIPNPDRVKAGTVLRIPQR